MPGREHFVMKPPLQISTRLTFTGSRETWFTQFAQLFQSPRGCQTHSLRTTGHFWDLPSNTQEKHQQQLSSLAPLPSQDIPRDMFRISGPSHPNRSPTLSKLWLAIFSVQLASEQRSVPRHNPFLPPQGPPRSVRFSLQTSTQ